MTKTSSRQAQSNRQLDAQLAEAEAEALLEQERVREVLLLLQHMFQQEAVTSKMIIDRLYDVATVHLINQRLPNRPVNRVAKWTARRSKPLAKVAGTYYLQKNCPQLIVNWLVPEVKELFGLMKPPAVPVVKPLAQVEGEETMETRVIQPSPIAQIDRYDQEIVKLRSQVKMLTVLLVGVVCTLGGALAWSVQQQQQLMEVVHPAGEVRAIVKE